MHINSHLNHRLSYVSGEKLMQRVTYELYISTEICSPEVINIHFYQKHLETDA